MESGNKKILVKNKSKKIYILTKEEEEILKSRIDEINNGEFIEEEQFFKEIEECLNQKIIN